MEIKNLSFGGHNYSILETDEDGEVRLFMLTEVDLEDILYAMPDAPRQSTHFRHMN